MNEPVSKNVHTSMMELENNLETMEEERRTEGCANGDGTNGAASRLPASISSGARKVFQCIHDTIELHGEGSGLQYIVRHTGMEIAEVLVSAKELVALNHIEVVLDDQIWALSTVYAGDLKGKDPEVQEVL